VGGGNVGGNQTYSNRFHVLKMQVQNECLSDELNYLVVFSGPVQ
jgi:hypothetical protein